MIDHDAQEKTVEGVTVAGTLMRGPAAKPSERSTDVAMRASLGRSFGVGFVLGGLLALATTLLVLQNGGSARINWLWWDFAPPLWAVLLVTLIAGALVWETARMTIRRGRRLRRERRGGLDELAGGGLAAGLPETPTGDQGRERDQGTESEQVYPDMTAWVNGWLAPNIHRPAASYQWCERWDEHPEAVELLTALWQSWEDHTGPDRASWLVLTFYPLWGDLTDGSGTFAACAVAGPGKPARHFPAGPLPTGPAPACAAAPNHATTAVA